MLDVLIQLSVFTAKAVIIVILILLLLAGIIALFSRGKEKTSGQLRIRNLNQKLQDIRQSLLGVILNKKQFKKILKDYKTSEKLKNQIEDKKNVFVLHFNGDMKASAVTALREEVTAIIGIAKPNDEVVVCIESAGGMVHAYGLAAAQLARFKQKNIPLTAIVDKVAASGGYLMACVANKILAAPFAIIGSIGVIFQLPNFNRLLTENNIDFEQITAGSFKRTLTLFGKNTPEGREKLREELEEIHKLFKDLIIENRKHLDINKIATGEHWLGTQALELKLVDELKTSDDYLLEKCDHAEVYEISYVMKKSFVEKVFSAAGAIRQRVLAWIM